MYAVIYTSQYMRHPGMPGCVSARFAIRYRGYCLWPGIHCISAAYGRYRDGCLLQSSAWLYEASHHVLVVLQAELLCGIDRESHIRSHP